MRRQSPLVAMIAMFDTNEFDWLVDDPGRLERVRQAMRLGRLRVLATRIQRDQLTVAPKAAQLVGLLEEIAELVPSSISVVGHDPPLAKRQFGGSRLGSSRLGDERLSAAYRALRSEDPGSVSDAIIAVTAWDLGAVLVTNDGRLRARCINHLVGLVTLSHDAMMKLLDGE